MVLKAIDGSGRDSLAPRPTKASLAQLLYDTVEASAGSSSLKQIQELLPASVVDSSQVFTRKQIEKGLYRAKYMGYLVHNGADDTYRIAPLTYYEHRQAEMKRLRQESDRRKASGDNSKAPRTPLAGTVFVHNWWITATCSLAVGVISFALGAWLS